MKTLCDFLVLVSVVSFAIYIVYAIIEALIDRPKPEKPVKYQFVGTYNALTDKQRRLNRELEALRAQYELIRGPKNQAANLHRQNEIIAQLNKINRLGGYEL